MYIINIINNPNILFITITFLIIICSLLIIINKNPIHSILFLVLIFVITTILFLTLNIDFIAMLFLVLYVGAIVVLFLFVVMMLNVRILELNERVISYIPIALVIVFIFFILILSVLTNNFLTEPSQFNTNKFFLFELFDNYFKSSYTNTISSISFFNLTTYSNLSQIGAALYEDYAYIFLLAGIILLIAMLGSIVLTLNDSPKSKRQDYYYQTNKNITKAIRHLY